jgi:hypothetical protein
MERVCLRDAVVQICWTRTCARLVVGSRAEFSANTELSANRRWHAALWAAAVRGSAAGHALPADGCSTVFRCAVTAAVQSPIPRARSASLVSSPKSRRPRRALPAFPACFRDVLQICWTRT